MFSNKNAQRIGFVLIIVLISISTFSNIQAARRPFGLKTYGHVIEWGENWQPPRVVGSAHLKKEHSSGIYTDLHGVCYDFMEKEKTPFDLYLGVGFHLKNLDIEPVVGYSFRDKEWVAGMRLYPQMTSFRSYFNLEYQYQSQSFYYQGQLSLRFNTFFDLGAEVEGWGDIDDNLESNGFGAVFGFNIDALKNFKKKGSKVRLEAAIQLRELMDEWKPQAIVRISLTPKMDEHSFSRSRH